MEWVKDWSRRVGGSFCCPGKTRDRVERDEETLNRTWRLILYMGTMSRNISKLMSRFLTFPHLLFFFFSAYFLSKGWQPSLFLISLTRNLIPSKVVITSNSAPVKSGRIPFNECMSAVLVLLQSSSLPTHCKAVDSGQRHLPQSRLELIRQTERKPFPSQGPGRGGYRPFLCAHSMNGRGHCGS